FRSKLDDFYKLLFFFVSSSYIFKTDFLLLFTIHFCLALTKIHDTATAASLSLAKKKEKQQSYNQKRDHCRQYRYPHTRGIFFDDLQDTLFIGRLCNIGNNLRIVWNLSNKLHVFIFHCSGKSHYVINWLHRQFLDFAII